MLKLFESNYASGTPLVHDLSMESGRHRESAVTILDIEVELSKLAVERPIFHSEADFQFSLAWQIQKDHPGAKIRLEATPVRNQRVDIDVQLDGERVAVELKYWHRAHQGIHAGESFDLSDQGAQPLSRYDFLKDVARCEAYVTTGFADRALAIALTNDPMYRTPGRATDGIDAAFRIHEGRALRGQLTWATRAGAGTTRSREAPIALLGEYSCGWRRYSTLATAGGKSVELHYLVVEVLRSTP